MSLGKDISNFLSLVIQLKNMDISDNSTLNELESSMERYYLKKLKKELGEEEVACTPSSVVTPSTTAHPVVHSTVVQDPIVSDPSVCDSSSEDELDMVVVQDAQQVAKEIAEQPVKDLVEQVTQEVSEDVQTVVQEVSQDVQTVVQEVSQDVQSVVQEVVPESTQEVPEAVASQ